jgi:hypothetical protein
MENTSEYLEECKAQLETDLGKESWKKSRVTFPLTCYTEEFVKSSCYFAVAVSNKNQYFTMCICLYSNGSHGLIGRRYCDSIKKINGISMLSLLTIMVSSASSIISILLVLKMYH